MALMAEACPLFKALTHLNGWGVEMKGDSWVRVGMVFNTMQPNRI